MTKLKVLKITNIILFASALTQATTGVTLTLLETGRLVKVVATVHEFNGFLLAAVIASHLYLNWPVVITHYFKKNPAQSQ